MFFVVCLLATAAVLSASIIIARSLRGSVKATRGAIKTKVSLILSMNSDFFLLTFPFD